VLAAYGIGADRHDTGARPPAGLQSHLSQGTSLPRWSPP
jgi:hypothetical protein